MKWVLVAAALAGAGVARQAPSLTPAPGPMRPGPAAVPTRAPSPRSAPASVVTAAPGDLEGDDARRAAAGRQLLASRFRERQAVLLPDGLKAAQGDLTTDCIDRATAGRSLADCRATTGPAVQARLAARRSDILDEILTASQSIYARRFTAAEMDEITRFFRTPVGRKYGDFYPQVIGEVQARRGAILRRYLAEAGRGRAR